MYFSVIRGFIFLFFFLSNILVLKCENAVQEINTDNVWQEQSII